jgi:hypothetical protein
LSVHCTIYHILIPKNNEAETVFKFIFFRKFIRYSELLELILPFAYRSAVLVLVLVVVVVVVLVLVVVLVVVVVVVVVVMIVVGVAAVVYWWWWRLLLLLLLYCYILCYTRILFPVTFKLLHFLHLTLRWQ